MRAALWIVALALFAWALSRVSLAEAWVAVRQLDTWAALALVAANGIALVVFGIRWWIILRALGHRIGIVQTAIYRLAAFGLSYFTPGPQVGGEPVQVLLAERRHGVPRDVAIASVGLDRLFDGVVNLAFLAASALVVADSATTLVLAVVVMVPLAYVVALALGRRPVSAIVHRDVVEASEHQAGRFCREHPAALALAIAASFATLGMLLFEYWLVAHFLGIPLSPAQLFIGLAAARIAYLLLFPAGLGVLEAGQITAVRAMGFSAALGLSLSLVIRFRDVLTASVGLWLGIQLLSAHEPQSPRRRTDPEPRSS